MQPSRPKKTPTVVGLRANDPPHTLGRLPDGIKGEVVALLDLERLLHTPGRPRGLGLTRCVNPQGELIHVA